MPRESPVNRVTHDPCFDCTDTSVCDGDTELRSHPLVPDLAFEVNAVGVELDPEVHLLKISIHGAADTPNLS